MELSMVSQHALHPDAVHRQIHQEQRGPLLAARHDDADGRADDAR